MDDGSDIGRWLADLGLPQYAAAFRDNDIDADVLQHLTSQDLREIGVASVGHRRKILTATSSGPTRIAEAEPERRLLTVLFCDLVDSTALSAESDPEDYVEFIASFRRELETAIETFGGHIANFLGDGVMATFGYPTASDHDAERAVAAGLAALEHVSRLPTFGERTAQARVGVASGLTVVGTIDRASGFSDRSAIGETPNLAARLQTLAAPGSLVISSQTRDLIGNVFECSDLGQHLLKGVEQPVRVWRVVGHDHSASRFDALRIAETGTDFIGRTAELARLGALIRNSAARAIVVEGDSGMGKSRLVRRAVSDVAQEGRPAIVLQCSPYNVGVPFEPIRHLLESHCGLRADDDTDVVSAKVVGFLKDLDELADDAAGLLGGVLTHNADTDLGAGETLTSTEIRKRTMNLLARILMALAGEGGQFVVEDAQWLDPTSAELLQATLSQFKRAGITLIATAGRGKRAEWLCAPEATVLHLDRLSGSDVARLVRDLAGDRILDQEMVDAIAHRSDGVPIFAVELTRGALAAPPQKGWAAAPTKVPVTLSESLQARLDRLTQGRRIACEAAAIGREFPVALLLAVTEMPEETARNAIRELVAADIVQPLKGAYGESIRFRHSLVKEAAYDLLLRRQRPALHKRIADTIATQFSDIAEKRPQVLAIQYASAGDHERAAANWRRAGRAAAQRSAYAESVSAFRNALQEVGQQPASRLRDQSELDIRLSLMSGLICMTGYRSEGVTEQTERVMELGRRIGESARLIPAMQALWVQLGSGNLIPAAADLARESLKVAEGGSTVEKLIAYRMCATSMLFLGEIDEALLYYNGFMEMFDPDLHGQSMREGHSDHALMVMLGLCECYTLKDDRANAEHWRVRMHDYAQTSERLHDIVHTLVFSCLHAELRDDHALVSDLAGSLDALMQKDALPNWWGHWALFDGLLKVRAGEHSAGLPQARRGVEHLIEVKAFGSWWYLVYAEAAQLSGQWKELEWALERIRSIETAGDVRLASETLRLTAILHRLKSGDEEAARACLDEGLIVARRHGTDLLAKRIMQAFGSAVDTSA